MHVLHVCAYVLHRHTWRQNTHIHLKIKSLKKNRKESQQGFKFILPRVNKVKQARLPGGQLRVVREPVSTAVHSERVLVGPRPCSP